MLNIRIHINHTYSYPPEGGKSTGRQPPDECRASTASNSEREPRSTANAAPNAPKRPAASFDAPSPESTPLSAPMKDLQC